MATASIVFRHSNPAYSNELLTHAKQAGLCPMSLVALVWMFMCSVLVMINTRTRRLSRIPPEVKEGKLSLLSLTMRLSRKRAVGNYRRSMTSLQITSKEA